MLCTLKHGPCMTRVTHRATIGSTIPHYTCAELSSTLAQKALRGLAPMSVVMGWADEVHFVGAASQHGHFVLCSDLNLFNLPLYSSFTYTAPSVIAAAATRARCTPVKKHTVMFSMTDGDSITWDLGEFGSQTRDWWESKSRGAVPVSWTFQPALVELHPLFLSWVQRQASTNDTLIAGPSGAGYTYLDQYPDQKSRESFAQWSSSVMRMSGMRIVNQIATAYHGPELKETVAQSVDVIFLDDYYLSSNLSGRVLEINSTIVTARRYALSKTFGVRVDPSELVNALNSASIDPTVEAGYSLVGVEVWGYGVKDIHDIVSQLDLDRVRVVDANEYIRCLRELVVV